MKGVNWHSVTLPESNSSKNGCLEDDRFLLGQKAYFQGRLLLVSGRVFSTTVVVLFQENLAMKLQLFEENKAKGHCQPPLG